MGQPQQNPVNVAPGHQQQVGDAVVEPHGLEQPRQVPVEGVAAQRNPLLTGQPYIPDRMGRQISPAQSDRPPQPRPNQARKLQRRQDGKPGRADGKSPLHSIADQVHLKNIEEIQECQ